MFELLCFFGLLFGVYLAIGKVYDSLFEDE